MAETPLWQICIVTTQAERNQYRSIKNALLFGDHIHWISFEVLMKFVIETGALIDLSIAESKGHEDIDRNIHFREPEVYVHFRNELQAGGAGGLITKYFDGTQAFSEMKWTMDSLLGQAKGLLPHGPSIWTQAMIKAIADSRVLVGPPDFSALNAPNWNAHAAAHELMMGVSRLLLPDVSDLPVEVIVDIREQLQDSLDPLRAEMLRLTEDLRKVIGTSHDRTIIAAEVDNLIAVRVEPVVRDANRRAKELLDRKWRKLLAGAAKAFGFAGAAFLDPKLFAKAVQQTLETGALALGDGEDQCLSLKETAQFVLHARRLAASFD
jgi:hypothetical protein